MPRPAIAIVLSFVLALLLGGVAFFTDGFWQTVLIGVATVFLTLAATEAYARFGPELEKPVFYVRILSIVLFVLFATCLYLGFALIDSKRTLIRFKQDVVQSEKAPGYPFASGVIADFKSGAGSPARTALHTRCSLASDSDANQDSLVWYRRMEESPSSEGGDAAENPDFLRVGYVLHSGYNLDAPTDALAATSNTPGSAAGESQVGIICAFSPPPTQFYDVSKFHNLAFRMRVQSDDNAAISVRVALYSKGIAEWARNNYSNPAHKISGPFTATWQTYLYPFSQFTSSDNGAQTFDPRAAFQIAFFVRGAPGKRISGSIDLTDIQFVR